MIPQDLVIRLQPLVGATITTRAEGQRFTFTVSAVRMLTPPERRYAHHNVIVARVAPDDGVVLQSSRVRSVHIAARVCYIEYDQDKTVEIVIEETGNDSF